MSLENISLEKGLKLERFLNTNPIIKIVIMDAKDDLKKHFLER
jgi:hypothetical protein